MKISKIILPNPFIPVQDHRWPPSPSQQLKSLGGTGHPSIAGHTFSFK